MSTNDFNKEDRLRDKGHLSDFERTLLDRPPESGEPYEPRERSIRAVERFRWRPGQSGNPSGRKGPRLTESLMRLLATECEEPFGIRTRADEISFALVHRATQGDCKAIEIILDRTEGRSPLHVALTGEVEVSTPADRRAMYEEIISEAIGRYSLSREQAIHALVGIDVEAAEALGLPPGEDGERDGDGDTIE